MSLLTFCRCILSFGDSEEDNRSKDWLQSLEAETAFPSVLLEWLDGNEETAEENIFIEESFIVPKVMGEEEGEEAVERRNRTCFLLFGFRVEDERTRRFFLRNWKEVLELDAPAIDNISLIFLSFCPDVPSDSFHQKEQERKFWN